MKTMETTQRRVPDDGAKSSSEESAIDVGEIEEDNETAKVLKMLEKLGSKPKMEIPMYEGILNA